MSKKRTNWRHESNGSKRFAQLSSSGPGMLRWQWMTGPHGCGILMIWCWRRVNCVNSRSRGFEQSPNSCSLLMLVLHLHGDLVSMSWRKVSTTNVEYLKCQAGKYIFRWQTHLKHAKFHLQLAHYPCINIWVHLSAPFHWMLQITCAHETFSGCELLPSFFFPRFIHVIYWPQRKMISKMLQTSQSIKCLFIGSLPKCNLATLLYIEVDHRCSALPELWKLGAY